MRINRLTLRSSSFLPLLLLGAISVPGNRQCTKDSELQLYKTNYSGRKSSLSKNSMAIMESLLIAYRLYMFTMRS